MADPTGVADAAGAGISLYRGDILGAGISILGIFGLDWLKKFRRLGKADNVVDAARTAAKNADEGIQCAARQADTPPPIRGGAPDGGGKPPGRPAPGTPGEPIPGGPVPEPPGGAPPRTLQTGGNTINKSTANALGLPRRDAGRALEALKKDLGLPNNHHGKIMSNGDYVDAQTGQVLGNLLDYAD